MTGDLDFGSILHSLLEGVSSNGRSSSGVSIDLSTVEIRYLCKTASKLFLEEQTLLQVEAPIQICGNLCGHFTDLVRLFDRGGYPPLARYLFLGGYVNRGEQSLETLCLLLVYKILYPECVFMLRGSHETELKAKTRGLRAECEALALGEIWQDLLDLFDCLPLAALVNDRIFCCYGGPPNDMESLDDIQRIPRPLRAPYTEKGIVGDLLYSKTNLHDPGSIPQERGHLYGKDVVKSFVRRFNLKTICRAKQVVMDGYELFADSTELITLFSVPNYRSKYPNDGALMQLSEALTVSIIIIENPASSKADSRKDDHHSNNNNTNDFLYHHPQALNQDSKQYETGQT
ncbi:Serine/threonine-protein phosphatase [Fasciola hepatica]|uniref:protein-serine/threonine phosphatase n=1 Tax=Fasciola hepatica TaxID=6192 RepID=A0A4E0RE14_FASHE|nr:Serine/threonine-protein phosphatase [Fasciola hepatica]